MNHESLIISLHKIGAIKFGEFTLKSGRSSKIYIDLRQIISYPDILNSVSNAIFDSVRHCHFERLCGVPYTALPIATCISLQNNIAMIMRRKEKKEYGTKQQIEGAFEVGQSCLIIEDIITSGSSILETSDDLQAAGLKITDAVVLINREQGGEGNLQQKNIKLHTVFTLKQILKHLSNADILSTSETNMLQELLNP